MSRLPVSTSMPVHPRTVNTQGKERVMNPYDALQQFIEALEQYLAGIETGEGLLRLARNVRARCVP